MSTGQRVRRIAWRLWRAPAAWLNRHVRPERVARSVRHVAGPTAVEYGPDEVLAICVVRNGEPHVRPYFEHHLALGVRHIVLLDNGSTDQTVAIAKQFAPVTIFSTDLPYRKYETAMKRWLARRFSAGRWNLCVDIDERFDYPFSRQGGITDLTRYLDERRFTAMVAQMLDMLPSDASPHTTDVPPEAACPYYDLTDIRKTDYAWGQAPAEVRMHWDGVRFALFGTRNGLTKAALVRVTDDVELFVDWHHVSDGRIADVTGVLLHYPFTGDFAGRVREAVRTGRYGYRTTGEYRQYLRSIEAGRGVRIPSGARRLAAVDSLVDEGFLVASGEWMDRASRMEEAE